MIPFIRKHVYRAFKKSESRLHELSYLFWECTTRCQLSCLHCGSDCSKDGSSRDMPSPDFFSAIDTIKPVPANITVVFTGGEPLLRTDIEICGRELRKRGFKWSLVTNGYLYDHHRHVSLLNAGLGALTISLDGLENSHQWLRNRKTGYNKVLDAIGLAASSKRLNFDVVTCVNQRNLSELPQIRKLLISKGVKAWRLFTIVPIGRAVQHPELFLTNRQFIELMVFIKRNRKNEAIDVKFSCEGYVGNYEPFVRDAGFFCRAGINIGSVLIDGSISACPNIDRSFSQGNIYTDSFYEVWKNRFEPFRNREWTKTGQCASCRDFKDCQGNGFHLWHGDKRNVLVCHQGKILGA